MILVNLDIISQYDQQREAALTLQAWPLPGEGSRHLSGHGVSLIGLFYYV